MYIGHNPLYMYHDTLSLYQSSLCTTWYSVQELSKNSKLYFFWRCLKNGFKFYSFLRIFEVPEGNLGLPYTIKLTYKMFGTILITLVQDVLDYVWLKLAKCFSESQKVLKCQEMEDNKMRSESMLRWVKTLFTCLFSTFYNMQIPIFFNQIQVEKIAK